MTKVVIYYLWLRSKGACRELLTSLLITLTLQVHY